MGTEGEQRAWGPSCPTRQAGGGADLKGTAMLGPGLQACATPTERRVLKTGLYCIPVKQE